MVLINEAFLDAYTNWAMYSPRLRTEGYYDFGLDYGGLVSGPFHQMGDMLASAAEIGHFIDQIHATTHTDQVDLVGYSEGGVVPFYYLNILGGAPHVHTGLSLDSPVRGLRSSPKYPLSQAVRRPSARSFRPQPMERRIRLSFARYPEAGKLAPASDT